MRPRAGLLVALAAVLGAGRAAAVQHPTLGQAARTAAVAVFPDVTPGPPRSAAFPDAESRTAPDSSLELLATNPYEADLAAALARQNLYGGDLSNPYSDEVHLANPYTDELRLTNPYSGRLELAEREIADLSLTNPYSASRPARSEPARATASVARLRKPGAGASVSRADTPGTLAVEAGEGFSGAVFVDGVGVAATGADLRVLPGSHTVTVYPAGGAPFTVSVDVRPGASEHLRLGR